MLASTSYSPADPTLFDLLAMSCPWVFMSAGHAIVLAAFSGLRPLAAAAWVLAWFVAGSLGGGAFTSLYVFDTVPGGSLLEALGLSGLGAIRIMRGPQSLGGADCTPPPAGAERRGAPRPSRILPGLWVGSVGTRRFGFAS